MLHLKEDVTFIIMVTIIMGKIIKRFGLIHGQGNGNHHFVDLFALTSSLQGLCRALSPNFLLYCSCNNHSH